MRDDIEHSAAIDEATSKTNPEIRIAVVAANAEVTDMVNAYLKAMGSHYPLRFFPTMTEARTWAR